MERIRESVMDGNNAATRVVATLLRELSKLQGNKTAEATFFDCLDVELKRARSLKKV